MLQRQKVILALLAEAGRPLSRTVLVKRAFLLRQETTLRDDATFYDFVPYKFGPFSFALYRELEALERDGFIASEDDRVCLGDGLLGDARERIQGLPNTTRTAVATISTRYRRFGQDDLLRDVYRRYPWYASKTERIDLLPTPVAATPEAGPAVYTIGYEGRSVDAFLAKLLSGGISAIADVRANPVSRKYGFAGGSLARLTEKLGLSYRHFPDLGIPSAARTDLTDHSSYQKLFDDYERDTLMRRHESIRALGVLMGAMATALVCMEADPRWCHRSRLAQAVSRSSGLAVTHL